METETKVELNKLSVPMAIIIAGVLVAGAVYFSSIKPKDATPVNQQPNTGNTSLETSYK